MSCVIVSVCSALLVAMNHVTLYIVYIQLSERARARVYTRTRVRDMCVRAYVRECFVCVFMRASLAFIVLLYTSRCAYVCCAWKRNTTIYVLARTQSR